MRKGFLIAIEGIDGSGKSTLAKRIATILRSAGYVVTETKEPTNGAWGQKIRDSKVNGRMQPQDEWAAFIADRQEHVRDVIEPALELGHVIITDRYYYSTAAYQSLRCGMTSEKAIEVNESFAPRPDLVVVMSAPVEVALERVGNREGGADSFEFEGSLRAAAQVFDGLRGEHIMHIRSDIKAPQRASIHASTSIVVSRLQKMFEQRGPAIKREIDPSWFKPLELKLADQVRNFQRMINRAEPEVPTVPSKEVIQARLRLMMEEAFEILESCKSYPLGGAFDVCAGKLKQDTMELIRCVDSVDLPEFTDALADLDFVVEGTRQEFGIDGAPIANAVYKANMAKQSGPVDPVTGKKLKPAGWVPPDIAGELVKQGWKR